MESRLERRKLSHVLLIVSTEVICVSLLLIATIRGPWRLTLKYLLSGEVIFWRVGLRRIEGSTNSVTLSSLEASPSSTAALKNLFGPLQAVKNFVCSLSHSTSDPSHLDTLLVSPESCSSLSSLLHASVFVFVSNILAVCLMATSAILMLLFAFAYSNPRYQRLLDGSRLASLLSIPFISIAIVVYEATAPQALRSFLQAGNRDYAHFLVSVGSEETFGWAFPLVTLLTIIQCLLFYLSLCCADLWKPTEAAPSLPPSKHVFWAYTPESFPTWENDSHEPLSATTQVEPN